jgi:ATP-dependent helicase HrpB
VIDIAPILAALEHPGSNLVVQAAPGAGKTTLVPPALLRFGPVLVLEPRRIAARMAARWVAERLGTRVGGRVGYQVRFEDVSSAETELRYITEGVLTRKLLADPLLTGTATVVLDEFHERHIETDLALALMRRLQKRERPDLRIVVMSATLSADPVREYLGGCEPVTSPGRLHPLTVEYTPHSAQRLEEQVAAAVDRLARGAGLDGDVLVFLPGAAEIRRSAQALEGIARTSNLLVLPLHGDLAPAEQDRAVSPAPGGQRKVILSTNVAESSITIEGVTAVIDSGLARIASDSAWTGLPRLEVKRISQASAVQRAGRAGRTAPGRVVRLYSEEDFRRRPEHGEPEILRRELSQAILDLDQLGAWPEIEWFEAPPEATVQSALRLLSQLGAFERHGREMARLPVHPRLARLMLEAAQRGAVNEAARVAAEISGGRGNDSDRVERQLRRLVRARRASPEPHGLEMSLLAGFPDRVAQRRSERDVVLVGGEAAQLADPHLLPPAARFLIAVDVEERREHGAPLVRSAWAIEPEWLIDLFPERVEEVEQVVWNRAAERVEAVSAMRFGALTLAESRAGVMPDAERTAALLAEQALAVGVQRFADPADSEALLERARFAAAQTGMEAPSPEVVAAALQDLCAGLRGFRELEQAARDGGLLAAVRARLDPRLSQALDRVAPERIALPTGRRTKVHYEAGKPPWIASRLQDFFGLRETPRVAGGKVPVLVHLLAPSQRPVQVTQDLAGFWERLYPQVRRELMRRYPRHAWPENPLTQS